MALGGFHDRKHPTEADDFSLPTRHFSGFDPYRDLAVSLSLDRPAVEGGPISLAAQLTRRDPEANLSIQIHQRTGHKTDQSSLNGSGIRARLITPEDRDTVDAAGACAG